MTPRRTVKMSACGLISLWLMPKRLEQLWRRHEDLAVPAATGSRVGEAYDGRDCPAARLAGWR
jgi:hypothetical protein